MIMLLLLQMSPKIRLLGAKFGGEIPFGRVGGDGGLVKLRRQQSDA